MPKPNFYRDRTLGRVAAAILDMAETRGVLLEGGSIRIDARLAQQDLADRIGTTRESVNRALANLKAVGAIRTEGRQIIVLDRQKLAKLCDR